MNIRNKLITAFAKIGAPKGLSGRYRLHFLIKIDLRLEDAFQWYLQPPLSATWQHLERSTVAIFPVANKFEIKFADISSRDPRMTHGLLGIKEDVMNTISLSWLLGMLVRNLEGESLGEIIDLADSNQGFTMIYTNENHVIPYLDNYCLGSPDQKSLIVNWPKHF